MRCSLRRSAVTAFWFTAAFLHALQVGAQGASEFDRNGPYLLVGGGYSFQNFSGVGPLNVDDSPNLIFDAGWRFHPYAAVDVGFEWNPGFDASFAGLTAELETYFATAGMKIYALTGRFQPFLHPNVGVMVAKFDAGGFGGDTIVSPALRVGGGIDVYVTRNLFVSLAAYYVLPMDSDLNDAQYVPLSGGVGWRF